MLFHTISGSRPYHSLTSNEKAQKFRLQQFPGVTGYGFFGDIITKCWQLEYGTMADVLKTLDAAGVYFSVVADFKTANHLKNVPVADGQLSR